MPYWPTTTKPPVGSLSTLAGTLLLASCEIAPPSAPLLSALPSVALASPPTISTPVSTLPVAVVAPPTTLSVSLVALGPSSWNWIWAEMSAAAEVVVSPSLSVRATVTPRLPAARATSSSGLGLVGCCSERYCSTVTTPVAALMLMAKAALPANVPACTTPTTTPLGSWIRLIAEPSVTFSPDTALVTEKA